jgi:hypothetical protein
MGQVTKQAQAQADASPDADPQPLAGAGALLLLLLHISSQRIPSHQFPWFRPITAPPARGVEDQLEDAVGQETGEEEPSICGDRK